MHDLEIEKEISKGVEQISELGQKYRHVHVELKSLLDATEHAEKYAEYSKRCQAIREYVKAARLKIKNLDLVVQENGKQAHADEEKKLLMLKDAEDMKVRKSFEIEEQVFRDKIEREVMNFELHNSQDIQKGCDRFRLLLDDYYQLLSNVKVAFGDSFETECLWKENFTCTINRIEKQIKLGKSTLIKLNDEKQLKIRLRVR